MNTENNKNVKLTREELRQIKGKTQAINQNKLALCNEQIATLENEVDNKRKALGNSDLSDEQKTSLNQKMEEDIALLEKLYDQRKELKK